MGTHWLISDCTWFQAMLRMIWYRSIWMIIRRFYLPCWYRNRNMEPGLDIKFHSLGSQSVWRFYFIFRSLLLLSLFRSLSVPLPFPQYHFSRPFSVILSLFHFLFRFFLLHFLLFFFFFHFLLLFFFSHVLLLFFFFHFLLLFFLLHFFLQLEIML